MKLLYIPYKNLNYLIILPFFVVLFITMCYSVLQLLSPSDYVLSSSSIIKNYKTLYIDTDGNGKKDTLDINIDAESKEYRIEITSDNGKKYILSPDSKTTSMGPYLPWWPLKITIADINMDSIPEIITQVSKSSVTFPLNVFRWNGKDYINTLSGNFDGISIADINGDSIPELITTENIPGTGNYYTSYYWASKSYRKMNTYLKASSRGYDCIQSIIGYLSVPFDEKFPPEDELNKYFTDSWIKDHNNIEYLENFCKDVVGIQLEDYMGEEIKLDKGSSKQDLWRLRYIVFRKFNTDLKLENYTAEIETEQIGSNPGQYKIKRILFKAVQ